jgi:glutathione synthase
MNIAFLVNQVESEIAEYTTTRLARAAARAGHQAWYVGLADVNYESGHRLNAHARAVSREDLPLQDLLERVQAEDSQKVVSLDELDALVLRNDRVEDLHERPWAADLGVVFGRMAAQKSVVVVNDPINLPRAASKLYLEEFPLEIRPRCLVSRDPEEIIEFIDRTGRAVLKPLYGAKGRNVFLASEEDPNVNQMIEAVLRDGYVLAQEYVAEAENGDTRLFLLEGEPLAVDGTYAAFRRIPEGDDVRSNISSGGHPAEADIGETELAIAAAMRDRLTSDGMFLVAIDIVGDKVVEINCESAGGFQSAEHLTGTDFAPTVIEALERRCRSAAHLKD